MSALSHSRMYHTSSTTSLSSSSGTHAATLPRPSSSGHHHQRHHHQLPPPYSHQQQHPQLQNFYTGPGTVSSSTALRVTLPHSSSSSSLSNLVAQTEATSNHVRLKKSHNQNHFSEPYHRPEQQRPVVYQSGQPSQQQPLKAGPRPTYGAYTNNTLPRGLIFSISITILAVFQRTPLLQHQHHQRLRRRHRRQRALTIKATSGSTFSPSRSRHCALNS